MTHQLSSALIRFAHSRIFYVCLSALTIFSPSTAVYAKAHCFCKLGPPSAPIKDFGQIATYNGQIGHDAGCRDLCNRMVDSYMNDPSNRAAACSAANGVSIVAYSAVGTKAYQVGKTYTCPQTNPAPGHGRIVFGLPTPTVGREIHVNNVYVDTHVPPPNVPVPIQTPFTMFRLDDVLKFHAQQWTYDAALYRENVLVEQFSKKSPVAFSGSVLVEFTGQPNNAVHGHTWKVQWHYNGPNFSNGSVSFFIP